MSERWPGEPAGLEEPEEDEDVAEEPEAEEEEEALPQLRTAEEEDQHAYGELDLPDDVNVLEGEPDGTRRGVAIVASRFNGEITNKLLDAALEELDDAGVRRDAITIMPVPGAFELPLAAMALAKTRRFACVVALGCVVRGETPHFDFIASEAASGLQLAALETGVPVAFGVLTVDVLEQAEARISKGAEAVRTALEMADAFAQLRASAR
jgi:6,7-dimethyl-8-ribityllumazine synthase